MLANAKKIMTSPVISVKMETSLAEVVKLMAQHHISGVPVVNDDNVVVGIISETDIVDYSSKTHVVRLIGSSKWISPYTEVSDIAVFRKGFEILARAKAQDVMSTKVSTVKEDASTEEIARLMKRRNINRIPVVDSNGKLIGVITRSNVVRYLAEISN